MLYWGSTFQCYIFFIPFYGLKLNDPNFFLLRGRHGSKMTEAEEDEEYLREEEEALGSAPQAGTLLTVQPSCEGSGP